jgi:preprotein translocase SecF subunit
MLQLLIGTNIPFMRHRRVAYLFSGALMLATVAWLVAHGGPRYGVDFTGGTLLQIRTSRTLRVDEVRQVVDAAGFRGTEIQQAGTGDEFLIRLATQQRQDPFVPIQAALRARFADTQVELRRAETVGPKVGRELRTQALWAVLGSLGAILVYVGWRYEVKYAFGAVIALFHDVFVTLGVLSFAGREVSLTVVAALLTIAGYSINDTIVVFDRIRERGKALRKETHSRAFDISVNETLSRTVITSLTVFLTAVALLVWGGEVLRDFSFAMVIGVGFGTYSSVYVASALALETWIWLDRRKGIQAE